MTAPSTSLHIWGLLAQIHNRISARASEQILPPGVSPAQAGLLRHIIDHAGQTQAQLANDLGVTKGNVSMLLEKLEQGGYISRRRLGTANLISPTAAGQTLMAELAPRFTALVEATLGGLTAQQRRRLLALLITVRRALDQPAPTVASQRRSRPVAADALAESAP